jgi:hypothetical protein
LITDLLVVLGTGESIKEESQRFVFNLAKQDLSFYYKQKLDSLNESKRAAWDIYNNTKDETINTDKVKLLSLKLIIAADEAAAMVLFVTSVNVAVLCVCLALFATSETCASSAAWKDCSSL